MVSGSNTYERRYPVSINAFCLSGASSADGTVTPSATLTHDDGDRAWMISMKWSKLPVTFHPADNPAEFLYGVLWAMMTDFDEHIVDAVTIEPSHSSEVRNDV